MKKQKQKRCGKIEAKKWGFSGSRVWFLETKKERTHKYFTESEIILASFDHNLIKCLKKNLGYLNINPKFGLIFSSNPIKYNNYNTNICDYIIQSKSSLNMKFLNFCKEKKMKVFVYTVNDNKVMNLLFKAKIDGIITNYPDLLNDIKMCDIV